MVGRETLSSITGRHVVAFLLVALLTVSAGCNGQIETDGDSSDFVDSLSRAAGDLMEMAGMSAAGGTSPAVDQVPERADSIVRVDGAAFEDEAVADLYETAYASANSTESMEDLSTLEDALDQHADDAGYDLRNVDEMVAFSEEEDNASYSGTIVHADWDGDAWVEDSTNGSLYEYEEATVDGATVHRPVNATGGQWYADLGDGVYVQGTEEAVRDVIAVVDGDGEAVDGPLLDTYADTRSGLVRFAMTNPDADLADDIDQADVANSTDDIPEETEAVSGSIYATSEDAFGLTTTWEFATRDAALDFADLVEGSLKVWAGAADNETLEENLRDTSVRQSGSTVTVEAAFENADVAPVVALGESESGGLPSDTNTTQDLNTTA